MGCHIGWEDFRRASVRVIAKFYRLGIEQHDVNEGQILSNQGKKKL